MKNVKFKNESFNLVAMCNNLYIYIKIERKIKNKCKENV